VNRGASTSRNLGIEHSRGRYIAFLDADDVYLPEKLERQVALLDAQPEVGALYGSTEYWHSWTGLPEDQERDYVALPDIPTERVYAPPSLINLIYVEKTAAVPCTCSLLVRREVIERTGGFEPEFLYLYTDQVFYTKILSATPVYVMSDCLDRYRQHEDSHCYVAKRTGERQDLELTFLSWQVEYLSRQESVPKEYQHALRRAIRQMRYPLFSRVARLSRDSVSWLLKSPAN
jgi:glycosyltransferase involved in cell wall biosynthesis